MSDPLAENYEARGDSADEYRYQVRACNDDACSDWVLSSWVDVHNLDNIEPAVSLVPQTEPGRMDYSVDVTQQGDALVSIPVDGAPGVNGLVPNIGIRYSGARYRQRTNEALPEDILGYGWRLSGFGQVRRCVIGHDNSESIQLDNSDSLCLNGEPLVLVSGSYWEEGSLYRIQRERFHLIELKKNAEGKKWFRVSTPDGRVQEYGRTADSRLRVGTSARFGWSLNKVKDSFDNTIAYKYHRDTVAGINYPLEVTYGNNGDAKITFEYGTRNDAPPQPLGPDEIEQEQLVLLHHINVSLDGLPLREYRLISEDEGEIENYRRLKYVQLCGYREEGTTADCLNEVEFNWLETDIGNPDIDFDTGIGEVVDSFGKTTQFIHTLIREGSGDGLFFERPFGEGMVPADASPLKPENGNYRWVVAELRRSNGRAGDWHETTYAYQGTGLVSDKNRGFLGYYAQRVQDMESGIVTYRQFRLDFPHFGQVARIAQYEGKYPAHNQVLTKRQFRYSDIALSTGADTTHYSVLRESLEIVYEQGQILGYNFTENSYSQQGYGAGVGALIDGKVHTRKAAAGATAPTGQSFWGEVKPASVSGVIRSAETTTSFTNRPGLWLIGFKAGEEIRHYDGNTGTTADRIQTMVATPHESSSKVESRTRFPGDPNYELTTSYQHNANGNLVNETTSGANIATRSSSASNYIDRRYPGTLTNPLGHQISITYDARFGTEKTVTDNDGRTTKIEYDAFGREADRTNPEGVVFETNYAFCLAGNCPVSGEQLAAYKVSTSSSITPTTDRYYDLLGRVIQQDTQSFDGSTVSRREYNYDLQGRLYLKTAPFFPGDYKPLNTYQYNLRNRVVQVDRPDGSQVRTSYTALPGNQRVKVRVEEDVLGSNGIVQQTQVKENLFNLAGDLVKTTDAVGTAEQVATQYTYDGSGLLESVVVNNDPATKSTFLYDNAGNRYSLTDPNLGTVITAYSALGQVLGQTDNKGQSISYQYDKLGRLLKQSDADGTAEWDYDPVEATGSLASRNYTENAVQIFSEIYSYNGAGKLGSVSTSLNAGGLSKTYQQSYSYDTAGRIEQINYPGPSSAEAHYKYNNQGYLWKITDGVNPLKIFDTINALGKVEQEVYGNGVITNRTYNAESGRLETIDTGSGAIQDNEYRWRSNGTLESRLAYSGGVEKEETFAYDPLNRLTSSQTWLDGNSQRTLTTQYDKLGNILSKTSSHAGDTDTNGYQYGEFGNAGPNAVSDVTIGGTAHSLYYDQNGAITHYDAASGDDKWITWNARQLPTEITVGASKTSQIPTARDRFRYGPNGQRFYRETSWMEGGELKTEKAFIIGSYEDHYPAEDPDFQRIEKTRIDSNIMHIAATDHAGTTANQLEYLHRDHLGSIEKITDEAGNLLVGAANNFAFDPYGSRRKSDWSGELDELGLEELLNGQGLSTKRGFTGHEHLDRTGLIHMNGRIYDPTLGRFMSPDPFVQAPTYSQSWNRYSYVVNNPLSLTDPTGYVYNIPTCRTDWSVVGGMLHGSRTCTNHYYEDGTDRDGGGDRDSSENWCPSPALDPFCMGSTPESRERKKQREEKKARDAEKAKDKADENCGNEYECVEVTASEATLDVGDITRNFIESNRNKAGQNFNAQRGDAAVYSACVNNQRIRDCMNRLDEYEKEYKQDKSIGKDPRVQVLMELMREVSKRSLCSLNNPCDLMPYYENGTEPPPLWPPEI
ncbi:RHS repeat-associated core domain-containing protein [Microbulbifer halophilus]|uniref:RHS repeat-associated core domain-containing protein n=2 Tax=Microbulbifer halophilus TaxID=453963 RepID=UPI00361645F7